MVSFLSGCLLALLQNHDKYDIMGETEEFVLVRTYQTEKGGRRMIRIALCDDEAKILDEVSEYIKSYAEKKSNTDIEIFRFDSARTLLSVLEDGKTLRTPQFP